MIPTVLEKCGYKRQEEAVIPTTHEKCGYERQEEAEIPTPLSKRGYERWKEDKIVHDLENEDIWNITIGRRAICLRIIGRYKIV